MKSHSSTQFTASTVPQRPLNPSPLEMIIYNYEVKAHAFHSDKSKSAPKNETSKAKQERTAKHQRDWQHLRLERRKIAAHFKLQTQLTQYREANSQRSVEQLMAEDHHPTKRLGRNLRAIGEAKPTSFHEAHHIIPGVGRYEQFKMEECRLNLHLYGYGINDPFNGVWLRNYEKNRPDDWATPESPSHRPMHTRSYENWIAEHFLSDNLPESIFLNRLRNVKVMLKTGTHPQRILQKQSNPGQTS